MHVFKYKNTAYESLSKPEEIDAKHQKQDQKLEDTRDPCSFKFTSSFSKTVLPICCLKAPTHD